MPVLSWLSATPESRPLGKTWEHRTPVGWEAMSPLPNSSCPSPHSTVGARTGVGNRLPRFPTPCKEVNHQTQKNAIASAQRHPGFEPATALQLSNQPWSLHELPLQFMLATARHIIALDSQRKSCQCYFYLKPLFELHTVILHT